MPRRSPSRGTPDPLAGPPPAAPRCAGRTATGAQCRRKALPGADRCAQHLGRPFGRSPGRPPKLTKEVADEIVSVLATGGYAETAAAAVGISPRTFRDWMQRGDPEGKKKADERYRKFRERVERAVAESESSIVERVRHAALTDWKAAAWLLERRQPDRWAGPRGRGMNSSVHPDDFASGETSAQQDVADDQVGPDGRPL